MLASAWEAAIIKRTPHSEVENPVLNELDDESIGLALSSSNIGIWKWDIRTNKAIWSSSLYKITGFEQGDHEAQLREKLHPEDALAFKAAIKAHLSDHVPYDVNVRIRKDGEAYNWFHIQGQAVWDENGEPLYMSGTMIDISKAVELQEKLERSEKELRLIFDNVPATIWFKDSENRILRANQKAADSLGMSVEALEGADTYKLFPEIAKKYHDDDLAVINSGTARIGIIEEYLPINGERRWVSADKIPYTDPDTHEDFVFVVATDVTAQKEIEAQLRHSEEQLAKVVDASFDGFWELNIPKNEIFISRRFYDLMGRSMPLADNHVPEWREYVFGEDRIAVNETVAKHAASNGIVPYVCEIRCFHQNGSVVNLLTRGKIIEWTAEGAPLRMIGTFTDLTQLKTSEEASIRLGRRLEVVANSSSVGLWDWPMDGSEEIWWSPVYFALLGMESGEVTPSTEAFQRLLHPDDKVVFESGLEAHISEGAPFGLECRLRHKTLGYRWFLVSGKARLDGHGSPVRMLGSFTDIHELKAANLALEHYTHQLEAANRELDQFTYVASHDLKTPLRGMHLLADWIEDDLGDALTDDVKSHVDRLRNRTTRMEALLADILAYSTAGKTEFIIEKVDTAEIIDEVVSWAGTGNSYRVVRPNVLPILDAPKSPLQQVFLNLIGNAMKHHDQEKGVISIMHREFENHHEFSIEDDGPGIPAEYQELVFKMFKTLKTRDEVEGSGLGLAIVKKLVSAMGGDIWLESGQEQRGSTFYFKIPKDIKPRDILIA